MTKILVMVKPYVLQLSPAVWREYDQHGTRLQTVRVESVPEEVIREHYSQKKDEPFYPDMIRDFRGKAVDLGIYEGDCEVFRKVMTPLRERLARFVPPSGTRHARNAFHVSETPEEAARELEVWKRFLDVRQA